MVRKGERPYLGPPKRKASRRDVPVPRVLVDALAEHLTAFPPAPREMLCRDESGRTWTEVVELVFTTTRGEPLSRSRFGDAWRGAVEDAGLPTGTSYHDLRHFYASLLIDHGESVKVVQRRLGHASATETLDTYSHLWPHSEDRTRDAVDSVLGRSCEPNMSQAAPLTAFLQVKKKGGGEPAGKPDSVCATGVHGPLRSARVTICLGSPSPTTSSGLPGARRATCRVPPAGGTHRTCLALLRTGFAWPPTSPPAPVRSYRTLSPLPRTRLPGPFGGLLSVARAARRRAWALPSVLPCGVRTFLGGAPERSAAVTWPAPSPQASVAGAVRPRREAQACGNETGPAGVLRGDGAGSSGQRWICTHPPRPGVPPRTVSALPHRHVARDPTGPSRTPGDSRPPGVRRFVLLSSRRSGPGGVWRSRPRPCPPHPRGRPRRAQRAP